MCCSAAILRVEGWLRTNGPDQSLDEIIKLKMQLRDIFIPYYLSSELFSWLWWLSVAASIIPLVIWWKVVNKKRLLEICVFGLLMNISSTFLDSIGSTLVLWEYLVHIVPQSALMTPVDLVVVPVVFMIIYQKFGTWARFIGISTVAAAVIAFIAEPIAVYIGLYKPITWSCIYSFPLYILLAICAKFLTELFKSRQAADTN